ncbi:inverse autotransporter beta domain-containing protein [Candidatus Omnitrophota bacterium]
MKTKKRRLSGSILFFTLLTCFLSVFIFNASAESALFNRVFNVSSEDALEEGSEVGSDENEEPEWLQRISLNIDMGTNQTSRYYFETVQPLYQDIDKQNTFFIQPRYSIEGNDGTYNVGMGYRRLFADNSILLGINSFWDAQVDHDHYRVGLGGEAFINLVELRSNAYFALSPRTTVNDVGIGAARTITYEQAVNGFDVEGGLPLPYMNWVSLYGGMYWYKYRYFDNPVGWRVRTQIKPIKYGTINLIAYDDNKRTPGFRVDGRITIPFDLFYKKRPNLDDIILAGFSKEAYPEKRDHSDKTLNRVEREYKIAVETWTEAPTGVVEIRRGTN